jgi:hypothetical protein
VSLRGHRASGVAGRHPSGERLLDRWMTGVNPAIDEAGIRGPSTSCPLCGESAALPR